MEKQIIKKIQKTIEKYELFSKKQKIFVAVSGGKDSTVMLYVLKKLGYKVEGITVNALIGNYSKENLKNIQEFCKKLGIKLHVISFREEFGHSLCYLRSLLKAKGEKIKSCLLCGVLRRYLINKHARLLKADVVVTGHNIDDEAQNVIMNLFKNNLELLARLGPKTGISEYKQFVKRVKPLYFISEKEIEQFSRKKKFPVVYTACPCRVDSFRNQIRKILDQQGEKAKENIVKHFISIKPQLMKKYIGKIKLNSCEHCGEPAKEKICKTCQIIKKIR